MQTEFIRTVDEARDAIAAVIGEQMWAALRSDYDSKVCVAAVSAADAVFRNTAVGDDPKTYVLGLIAKLTALRDAYDDPDGEYTNGSSSIGSVLTGVERVSRRLVV